MTSAFFLRPPFFFCSAIAYSSTILHGLTRRHRLEPVTKAPGTCDVAPYNRLMRSRLNLALVVMAGSLALVLTVIRRSPEGVVTVGFETQEVRAAPGEARNTRHD